MRRVPLGTRRYVRRRLWLREELDIGSGIIPYSRPEVNGFRASGCETDAVIKLVRRGVVVGAFVALAYAAWRFVAARGAGTDGPGYEPQPFPMPPRPVAFRPERGGTLELPGPYDAPDPVELPDAIDPDADGSCPVTHPIKGKLSTGIFHRPGAFAYDRTRADRCYRDESAAESDGLRAAKR